MRRLAAVVVVCLLGVGALALPAQAGGRSESYSSEGLNAFWHSKRRVGGGEYRKTTWYAGAYLTTEGDEPAEFWSDLYRSVELCERRDGRDRCRTISNAIGVINDIGDGYLYVDADFESAEIQATYRICERDRRGCDGPRRTVTVTATLAGRGKIRRSVSSHQQYEGSCLKFEYSDDYTYRRSIASGTLTGDVQKNLGDTKEASFSRGESSFVQNEC
jgi:hypothetical protein